MAFWDKVKDFVGIEDEYYDDEDFYDEEDVEEDTYSNEEEIEYTSSYNADLSSKTEESSYRAGESVVEDTIKPAKEVQRKNRSYGVNEMTVSIKEPLEYEDGQGILDDIIAKKTVILNLEMLEMDKKTQIFYFVSGGLYSLRGSIQNVTKDIYVLAPEGVDVDKSLKDTISEKSLYQI